jgi:hypothetical protein
MQFKPKNAALWADLQQRLGTNDLVEWLETASTRLAELGRTQLGRIAFTSTLLRDRRISVLLPKPYLSALATIVPRCGRYEVYYRPFQRVEDQRFWIAHEIAHTFWFADQALGDR